MNRHDPLFPRAREARIRYLDADFQVLEEGDYVRCAVTGQPIKLMGVGEKIMKLFEVVNYDQRVAGYKDVEKFAVTEGAAMPILQAVMTTAYKDNLKVVQYANGWSLPQYWSWN